MDGTLKQYPDTGFRSTQLKSGAVFSVTIPYVTHSIKIKEQIAMTSSDRYAVRLLAATGSISPVLGERIARGNGGEAGTLVSKIKVNC